MIIISIKEVPHEKQHECAHGLLKCGLKNCGIEYNDKTEIIYNSYGKPSLADYPEIHYNLSHSAGIAACVISKSECGIDAEKIKEYRSGVARRAFSDSERNMLENISENMRDLMFYRLWTLKESFVKAVGIGISYPMRTVEFLPENLKIITNVSGYSFRQYIFGSHVVSLCERNSVCNSGENVVKCMWLGEK